MTSDGTVMGIVCLGVAAVCLVILIVFVLIKSSIKLTRVPSLWRQLEAGEEGRIWCYECECFSRPGDEFCPGCGDSLQGEQTVVHSNGRRLPPGQEMWN